MEWCTVINWGHTCLATQSFFYLEKIKGFFFMPLDILKLERYFCSLVLVLLSLICRNSKCILGWIMTPNVLCLHLVVCNTQGILSKLLGFKGIFEQKQKGYKYTSTFKLLRDRHFKICSFITVDWIKRLWGQNFYCQKKKWNVHVMYLKR